MDLLDIQQDVRDLREVDEMSLAVIVEVGKGEEDVVSRTAEKLQVTLKVGFESLFALLSFRRDLAKFGIYRQVSNIVAEDGSLSYFCSLRLPC